LSHFTHPVTPDTEGARWKSFVRLLLLSTDVHNDDAASYE
jgi:hypothetical protein